MCLWAAAAAAAAGRPAHAAETCPGSTKNPRVAMSGVAGTGQCNICVAGSDFWFHNTIVKDCSSGGHKKRKYEPTSWTADLLATGDHTLAEYLNTGASDERALLYHGTSDANLKFMIGTKGKVDFEFGQNHMNQLSRGFYLTASPNEAKTYACQPKAPNKGRVAVLVVDPGPANMDKLLGREEKGISTRSISKSYVKKTKAMDRLRTFDATPASFIRLANKRNQFAFKGGPTIDSTHPKLAPKLVAVVLLGNRYQRLAETDENRKRTFGSYVGRCKVAGLQEPDDIPEDYTFGKLGLAETCGKQATEQIPLCQEGAFQTYETAGVLATCSSKSDDGSCAGGDVGDGELQLVPEGELGSDGAEVDGEESDAPPNPDSYTIPEDDADEIGASVKFSSSLGSLGEEQPSLRANTNAGMAFKVFDKIDDILDKEIDLLAQEEAQSQHER